MPLDKVRLPEAYQINPYQSFAAFGDISRISAAIRNGFPFNFRGFTLVQGRMLMFLGRLQCAKATKHNTKEP